ncbi:N5-glutamine methyltransferase family protein [Helicobacter kayseriensis]|uniref:N5-glutamine methyltransferase family protein n=1 Tax=Helicobacter kayseriensis TaxID=2905877 RepID=UPI001E4F7931|nr:HemK/PrmC family methyltransferase [Helicobacter kayseriensis]MCE3047442.1 peptide chain release factor N(5)-glutamine methyltransferase [Helicobacter kayseriensis]MCE3048825.1 peptide chain release factor N(5)-glutamine methyltransferase [Helicobacter kayseriensis]
MDKKAIRDALAFGVQELAQLDRPRLKSEILLAYILGVERTYLHAFSEKELQKEDFEKFQAKIARAKSHMPIEYLTERVGFYGYVWNIKEGVLIPRPETEILIEKASELIQKHHIKYVFEFGMGSGIIGITLALLHPEIEVVGSDINPLALQVSQINLDFFCKNYDKTLENRVKFARTNILEDVGLLHCKTFDLLVSNPPYIGLDYSLPPNVRYEPKEALFGGEGGEEILYALVDRVCECSIPFMVCEMGYDQRAKMQKKLQDKFSFEFYQDLSGLDRGFLATLR